MGRVEEIRGDASKKTSPTDEVRMLYRTMRKGEDGQPVSGTGWCMLGVRTSGRMMDIPVVDGCVEPETEGLSVTPDDPRVLMSRLIPKKLGGRNPYDLWCIREDELGPNLKYRPDPTKPDTHGFLEPARHMRLEDYQQALEDTRSRWQLVEQLEAS